jgi:nucleotide-binding universal stress UspA family protein
LEVEEIFNFRTTKKYKIFWRLKEIYDFLNPKFLKKIWRYGMYRKILLPTDGSENAKRAGEQAISLADVTGADIIVLNIIDVNYLQPSYLPSFREDLEKELRNEGKRAIERFEENLEESQCAGKCKNVKFTSKIEEGKPHEVILQIMDDEDVDVVVMGASGRHGLDRVLLGSTTERVVRETTRPVLVVP